MRGAVMQPAWRSLEEIRRTKVCSFGAALLRGASQGSDPSGVRGRWVQRRRSVSFRPLHRQAE